MAYQIALALGAKLAETGLKTYEARRAAKRRRREQLRALQPVERQYEQNAWGLGQTEGAMVGAETQAALMDQASRGVLQSSSTAAEVNRRVSPILLEHQRDLRALGERIAAAKQAIYAGSEVPGYEGAFAEGLGEAGDLFAMLAGQESMGGDKAAKTPEDKTGGIPGGLEPGKGTGAEREVSPMYGDDAFSSGVTRGGPRGYTAGYMAGGGAEGAANQEPYMRSQIMATDFDVPEFNVWEPLQKAAKRKKRKSMGLGG